MMTTRSKRKPVFFNEAVYVSLKNRLGSFTLASGCQKDRKARKIKAAENDEPGCQ